jgi:hypothetical protein
MKKVRVIENCEHTKLLDCDQPEEEGREEELRLL